MAASRLSLVRKAHEQQTRGGEVRAHALGRYAEAKHTPESETRETEGTRRQDGGLTASPARASHAPRHGSLGRGAPSWLLASTSVQSSR